MLHDTVALIAYEEPEVWHPCRHNKLQYSFMQPCASLLYGHAYHLQNLCLPQSMPQQSQFCFFGRDLPMSVLIVPYWIHVLNLYAFLG